MTTQHPKLFDLVRQRIRYKHMSYRTEQAYCGWIKRYVIFHQMRHPQEMGRLEVESYLSHLVNVGMFHNLHIIKHFQHYFSYIRRYLA